MNSSDFQKHASERQKLPCLLRKGADIIKKIAFLLPGMIVELFALITMSASLGIGDMCFLTVSVLAAVFSLSVSLFFRDAPALMYTLSSWISLAALPADVLILRSSVGYSGADAAILIMFFAVGVFYITRRFSGSGIKLTERFFALAISTLGILGAVALYWSHGELFTVQDPLHLLLCHVCAALCTLVTYYRPKCHITIKLASAFIIPFAAFLLLEFLTHIPFLDISLPIFLLNTALFLLFAWVLIFAFGRSAPALIITVILPLVLGLVSYFTVEFRGTPLFPWDLASYGIAATVLGGYDLTVPPTVALVCSCAVLVLVCSVVFGFRLRFRFHGIIRPVAVLLICCVLFGGGAYLQTDDAIEDFDLYPYLFVPHHLYKTNGFAVSFLMNLRYTTVDKPEGYSEEGVAYTAGEYASDSISDTADRPNVIVIMNESFADMKKLCDFETNTEYMPFISSLEDNTLKGDAHVSIVGGNTPNSEFEFLTGMTMGYLPSGSIPYQQFIKSERPTLATQLDSLGYHTVGMHPYWAEGWKREIVYPLLGFEEMHFLDYDTYGSFNEYPRVRDYISDAGVYDKIRLEYEENGDGDPLFIFAVTMQNHSGYSQYYENFHPEVEVEGLEGNFELSTYMSLIRESDAAFEGLIEYFKSADEPTVILMFGDHQPNDSIAYPLMNAAGMTYDDSNIEASERRYTVPYVIWANYELDISAQSELSLNYLSSLLMDRAGLPMTGAQKLALELMKDFPVITGRCIKDKNGNVYPVSDHVRYDKLTAFSHLQYCYLFDSDNMPQDFWNLKK
ncbi:MAG: sulfatase-like hydrolase/transferase [Clostridia bacterium]|nr:sulfatase-like hydrolase/transferase [Clostridia bacterium]